MERQFIACKSLEIRSIVQEAKENGISIDHIRRLQQLSAKPKLIEILAKRSTARSQTEFVTLNPKRPSLTDRHYIIRHLQVGDCWQFHNAIAAVLEAGKMTELSDSNNDTNLSWQLEAFELLGFPSSDTLVITDALGIADERFIRSLYRSAAVAYGLIHLIWPCQNPWTLFNWLRSLEHAHPDIRDRVSNLIMEP